MHNRPDEDLAAADPRWPSPQARAEQQFPSRHNGGNFDEFDEIEDRAAQLLARVAEQRVQWEAQDSEAVDDIAGTTPESWQITDEYEPQTAELSTEPVGAQNPYSGPDPIVSHQPVMPEDETLPKLAENPGSRRQMVLPPWQSYTPSIGPESDATQDGDQQSEEFHPPAVEHEEPTADSGQLPSDPLTPPTPTWQPGPSIPGHDWQGPHPGWPPGLPPLPPGWQGPPPWMLPPEQLARQQFGRTGSSTASPKPNEPRHRFDDAGRQWTRRSRHSTSPTDYAAPQPFRIPSLREAEIDHGDRHAPESGWQHAVYRVTGSRVNPGISRKDRERQALLEQIRQPIAGDFRIAVLSLKGGVGKTTTTLGLGSALATVRTDRVIAIDANPDRGTLAERVPDMSTTSTVRDLLRDPNIKRYADVRNHTRMAPSRLEVLASEQDPEVAEVYGEADYRRTMEILRHYYNIILTDCGTGIMHSAMTGVLDFANAIVLVTSAAIDSARSASATLDWLTQHGHGALVREAHVVLTAPKPGSAALRVDKVVEHFGARCKSTHVIPFERHLAEGAHFEFGLLKPATMQAYLELAGAVSEKFSWQRQPYPAN